MGIVFKAEAIRLHRFVALPDDVSGVPQSLVRIQREGQAASALSHRDICTIYDVGELYGPWRGWTRPTGRIWITTRIDASQGSSASLTADLWFRTAEETELTSCRARSVLPPLCFANGARSFACGVLSK